MCDVPSIAVFCSESIKCFPGTASKFFLKLLITIPVAPIITGIIVHFRFNIRYISIHKVLYFNFFSASFCTTFLSAGIATSISVHVFSFLFLIITSGLFVITSLSVCTAWFHNNYYYHHQCTAQSVFRQVHELLPQRMLQRLWCSGPSFRSQCLPSSLRPSTSCWHFLLRLPVTFLLPCILPLMTCFIGHFLHRKWPILSAVPRFIVRKIFLSSLLLFASDHLRVTDCLLHVHVPVQKIKQRM